MRSSIESSKTSFIAFASALELWSPMAVSWQCNIGHLMQAIMHLLLAMEDKITFYPKESFVLKCQIIDPHPLSVATLSYVLVLRELKGLLLRKGNYSCSYMVLSHNSVPSKTWALRDVMLSRVLCICDSMIVKAMFL
ncbi:hypothetical protein AKJ16_DCAP15060 [Drosera capensis]